MGVELSRRLVRVPTHPNLAGNGVYSLAGGFSRSAVLFDEPPELKHVRAKALRAIAAKKAKTVFGTTGDVRYVV